MADVHCVYVKVPEMTAERVKDAASRGRSRARPTIALGGLTRGAAALGVALALGEVEAKQLSDDVIGRDWNLYSQVAQVSSGIEQTSCKVLVIGNARGSASDLVAGHCVMRIRSTSTVQERAPQVGLAFACCPDQQQIARVENIFIRPRQRAPRIRGRRHTMHTDFLWAFSGAQAKAMADAMVAPSWATRCGSGIWLRAPGPRGSNVVAIFARA